MVIKAIERGRTAATGVIRTLLAAGDVLTFADLDKGHPEHPEESRTNKTDMHKAGKKMSHTFPGKPRMPPCVCSLS